MTDPKTFPIQDGRPIPWSLIAPHEAQAMENHSGQSLRRLAERQGLSPCEAMCAIRGEGIGKLLREPHGLRRDTQTGETICRCTCFHDLEDLAEKHRRESSAPSELKRLREALRIAEQERDGLRTELTQCRWDARHVAGCADTKTWEADNRVDYVQKRFQAELDVLREALRIAERERDDARATNQRLNRRCGDYERAVAEKRSLCSDGKPRGSNLSRALLNAYVSELLAENEVLRPAFEKRTASGTLVVRAGDVLEGVEGDVTTRIQVIYVSEETLLARLLWSLRGDGSEAAERGRESTWTLSCRDWRHVGEGERDEQLGSTEGGDDHG